MSCAPSLVESSLYSAWAARSGLLVNHHGGPRPDPLVGRRHGEYPFVQDTVIKCKGGAGFRDFRLFNQALLAQQAWRLLTRPDSLCARLLKSKYYPNGKLEDTVFPGNASSIWTAVGHGLDLLKKGLIWRVGDGKSIRMWRDSWIPRPFSYRPISPQGLCRLR